MQLKKGDKVRIVSSNEGAEIIKVIDEFHAVVETFDGEVNVHTQQVKPYQSSDVRKEIQTEYTFLVEEEKIEKKKKIEPFSLNSRKNRFSYEFDLHAEKIISSLETKSKEEILSIQLHKAKEYLIEANELRIQRVYLIHGIGSGRLKSEIDTILSRLDFVISFDNAYHPKYGKGATEVKLRGY